VVGLALPRRRQTKAVERADAPVPALESEG
jgi:hypothetical protein